MSETVCRNEVVSCYPPDLYETALRNPHSNLTYTSMFVLGVQHTRGVFARADCSYLDAYRKWVANLAHSVEHADVKQDISSLILCRLHGKRCQTVKENTDCKQTCTNR